MTSKAVVTKEELQHLIENLKTNGGDTTDLETLLAEFEAEEAGKKRKRRRSSKAASEEGEQPAVTPVGEYWDLYHSLSEPFEMEENALHLKRQIEDLVQGGVYTVDPTKSLQKHCIVVSTLGVCPWAKEPCICVEVKGGGGCKMGLLRQ